MTVVFLGLGSNIADKLAHLRDAVERLRVQVDVVVVSSVYETEPVGYVEQSRFLNMVIEVETALPPHDLLRFVKEIESGMGREATFRYGPRNIDIDILLYGTETLESSDLVIPHAAMSERAFVLVPLAEIAAGVAVPSLGATAGELATRVEGREGVRLFGTLDG